MEEKIELNSHARIKNPFADSPESNANKAIREAIRVRSFVLSSLAGGPLDRFPSGQMLFLLHQINLSMEQSTTVAPATTYSIAISRCSILSTSINDLAAWIIFLLAVWLTHGAPNKRLIIPRLNHCDRACKSNTSSSRFSADVSAGYSDDCCWGNDFHFQFLDQFRIRRSPPNEWEQRPRRTLLSLDLFQGKSLQCHRRAYRACFWSFACQTWLDSPAFRSEIRRLRKHHDIWTHPQSLTVRITVPPDIFRSFVSGSTNSLMILKISSVDSACAQITLKNSFSTAIRCSSTDRWVFWNAFLAGNGTRDIVGYWKFHD